MESQVTLGRDLRGVTEKHRDSRRSILVMTCVLLAEDDASISEPLARALRREGYDVDVSSDGPGTLEAAQAGGIDLIVLDIGLPRLDGLEVCRRL